MCVRERERECVCVCVCLSLSLSLFLSFPLPLSLSLSVSLSLSPYVCVWVCLHECVRARVCVRVYVCEFRRAWLVSRGPPIHISTYWSCLPSSRRAEIFWSNVSWLLKKVCGVTIALTFQMLYLSPLSTGTGAEAGCFTLAPCEHDVEGGWGGDVIGGGVGGLGLDTLASCWSSSLPPCVCGPPPPISSRSPLVKSSRATESWVGSSSKGLVVGA